MNQQLTPALKGLITGVAMIVAALFTYQYLNDDSPLHYVIYLLYAMGITWTLISYTKSDDYSGKFWDKFNKGFRCFVIVTLIMAVFTFVFTKMHPEFAEETAVAYRAQLVKESNSLTPKEIDEKISQLKNGYTTFMVYKSIFGYLIFGAAVTAVLSVVVTRRK